MKLARVLALALAALPFVPNAAAPAPVPGDAKDDAKAELGRLAGTWQLVSYKKEGVELLEGQDDPPEIVITFKKDGTFEWGNGAGSPGKIALIDPSKKPKEVDYLFTEGKDKDKTQKAIYKLDGDTFTDCFTEAGAAERPTEFKSTKDNGYTIIVYKRIKRKD
jgi:uncharacterized protein (TIGR03067 family)